MNIWLLLGITRKNLKIKWKARKTINCNLINRYIANKLNKKVSFVKEKNAILIHTKREKEKVRFFWTGIKMY